jgi:predicted nucleic acid-binding protein
VIVVDASVALKLVLNETDSQTVRTLWQQWVIDGEKRLAPPLFRAETLSVIRRSVQRGLLSDVDGTAAVEKLLELPIEIREPHTLYRRAWQLAERFQRPTIYDCCYLALAEIEGCEMWTADRRLANVVGTSAGVRLL